MITNPPYSGEHKVQLIAFLKSQPNISFALLLPAYTVTKSYWQHFVTQSSATSSGKLPQVGSEPYTLICLCLLFFYLSNRFHIRCHTEKWKSLLIYDATRLLRVLPPWGHRQESSSLLLLLVHRAQRSYGAGGHRAVSVTYRHHYHHRKIRKILLVQTLTFRYCLAQVDIRAEASFKWRCSPHSTIFFHISFRLIIISSQK